MEEKIESMREKVVARIHGWQDLDKFGIQILTGEACGIGMRVLCDLNRNGKKALEEFFGGRLAFSEGGNWNSEVCGEPAVASVMLPPSLLDELAAFCLLRRAANVVAVHVADGTASDAIVGFQLEKGDDLNEIMKPLYMARGNGFRTYHVNGTRGTRNQHAMSGRVC